MLLQIDDLSRPDHAFLTPADKCFYIREYTSNEGFQASSNNQLVFNLKCPINHSNAGRLYWKQQAVRTAARDIRDALAGLDTRDTVFIPLPPSKQPSTSAYDSRVRDMLRDAETNVGIQVIDALSIIANRPAAHETPDRPTIAELVSNFRLESEAWIGRKTVAIFDDVLTTGTQFKAAVSFLRTFDPKTQFVGVFWVRRVFPE